MLSKRNILFVYFYLKLIGVCPYYLLSALEQSDGSLFHTTLDPGFSILGIDLGLGVKH